MNNRRQSVTADDDQLVVVTVGFYSGGYGGLVTPRPLLFTPLTFSL